MICARACTAIFIYILILRFVVHGVHVSVCVCVLVCVLACACVPLCVCGAISVKKMYGLHVV